MQKFLKKHIIKQKKSMIIYIYDMDFIVQIVTKMLENLKRQLNGIKLL